MIVFETGKDLIDRLTADPESFRADGVGIQLLDEYFDGMPIQTLRPLLTHSNDIVREEASWIAFELAPNVEPLLPCIIELLTDVSQRTKYRALQTVGSCSVRNPDLLVHVARAIGDSDEAIACLAMRMMCRVDRAFFEQIGKLFDTGDASDQTHSYGLSFLGSTSNLNEERILGLLSHKNSILSRYGAVAAMRVSGTLPSLLSKAASNSDPIIRDFARDPL